MNAAVITIERPAVIATVGLPGSGKTTWADQQVAADSSGLLTVVNRDHIRAMTRKPYPTGEDLVTKIQQAAVTAALDEGFSVIIDDTNLNPAHLRRWRELATTRRYPVTFVTVAHFLFVPLREVLRRNAQRTEAERVPESAIVGMRDRWSARCRQTASDGTSFTPNNLRIAYGWDEA